MPSEDEIRKLLDADAKVRGLTASLQAETDAVIKNVAALKAQGASQEAVNAAIAAGKARIDAQVSAMSAAQGQLTAGSAKVANAANAAATATNALAEGGIKGLASAVPGLASAFMGPVGLVAAMGAVSGVIELLKPQVEKLIESLDADRVGPFVSALERGITRLEELKKKAELTAEDVYEKRYTEKGIKERESARKAGESLMEEVGHPGPDVGKAVADTLAHSPEWTDARNKTLNHLSETLGNQSADKVQAELEDQQRRDNEALAPVGSKPVGMDPTLAKEYARRIAEGRKRAKLEAQNEAGEKLGGLVSRARKGDPEAVDDLIRAMRSAGADDLAGRIEGAANLAWLKANPMGPDIPAHELRNRRDAQRTAEEEWDDETARFNADNARWRDRKDWKDYKDRLAAQEWDDETARLEHGNQLHRDRKADRAEKDQKRIDAFNRARPDWNPETDEMAMFQAMGRGKMVTEERDLSLSQFPLGAQERTRRDRRWHTVRGADGRLVDRRTIRQGVNLEEASKMLEESRYEELVKAGVDRSTAREQAKQYGQRAYGSVMQRGADNWQKLAEMQATGQVGRGVQIMNSEQAIDAVQTAREGYSKQEFELQKTQAEALVWLREFFRQNGVPARVGRRRGGP